MSALLVKNAGATDIVARDVGQELVQVDPTNFSRLGWLIVLLGVGGFLLWANYAPLDKGVPVSGNVAVAGNRKTVQHLTGGTVDEILVKEGDVVKAGQVLVRMNSVQVKAAAEITRGQYYSARAAEARLLAERDGQSAPTFDATLLAMKRDPRASEAMQLQQQLFTSRRMALQNELGAVDENIAGLKAHMAGLAASKESKLTQQQLLREQLVGMRELAKDGFVARNRLLELERGDAQLIGTLAEDAGNMAREQRQISELGLRRAQRLQEFQREVRTQLADVQKEVEAQFTRLAAQDFDLANAEVKAPVGGAVVGLTVFTHGGVVAPGAHLMEIVPLDDGLVIEGEVPVNLIDKVHAGLEVEMIFSAFNVNQTPHIPGIVTHVSADRMMNERTGVPSYKLKVKATPKGMKLLAKLAVRPGMPVDLFVKTGERNMMSYLLKPIFDRANTSMTEE